MKDKHGIQRGQCKEANCECMQYWPPPPDSTGGKLHCEYCNHLPGKHLRIVPLGACSGCGQKDNCTKYEPENDWSYSECQYCGCDASLHEGAKHLKPNTTSPTSTSGASPSLKLGPNGTPVQTLINGPCKCQGCPFGRRLDPTTGHVLEYCSKSCATKDNAGQPPVSSSSSGATSVIGSINPGLVKQFLKTPLAAQLFTAIQGSATPVVSSASNTSSPPSVPPSSFGAMCTKCNANPANSGHKWCQQCFVGKPSDVSTSTPST